MFDFLKTFFGIKEPEEENEIDRALKRLRETGYCYRTIHELPEEEKRKFVLIKTEEDK